MASYVVANYLSFLLMHRSSSTILAYGSNTLFMSSRDYDSIYTITSDLASVSGSGQTLAVSTIDFTGDADPLDSLRDIVVTSSSLQPLPGRNSGCGPVLGVGVSMSNGWVCLHPWGGVYVGTRVGVSASMGGVSSSMGGVSMSNGWALGWVCLHWYIWCFGVH